jgi:hypothetical protein
VIWLHIRVCWNRTPGKIIMYLSIAMGIAIPLILLGATLAYSGFSYELGPTCFIHHEHSFVVFWGWMIGFTCAAFLLQLVTSCYCVYVFFMSHRIRLGSTSSIVSTSTFGSLRRLGRAKRESQAEVEEQRLRTFNRRRDRWKGIHKVLMMQWRIISLTVALVIQCLYFGSVSWAEQKKSSSASTNPAALEFGECLFTSHGNREKCLPIAEGLILNKPAVLAGIGVMAVRIHILCRLSYANRFTHS